MNKINGNLITLALEGEFDVIVHGCNCFCVMKAGIAVEMDRVFKCNNPKYFKLEGVEYKGDVNKLGCIEGFTWHVNGN